MQSYRYLLLALLVMSFSAHALQSLRVGSQVLSIGDSAARVKALLGDPGARTKEAATGKSGAGHKTTSKPSAKKAKASAKGSKARKSQNKEGKNASIAKGEKWVYQREGHITVFTIVGGKIANIEDAAR